MRGGMTQGDALVRAIEETRVEWTILTGHPSAWQPTPLPVEKEPAETTTPGRPRSARTATTLRGGARVCTGYNEGTCNVPEDQCPHRGKHVCNVVLQRGGVCGKPHKRAQRK